MLQPLWYAGFLVLHQRELSANGLFAISTWDTGIGFGARFANKSFTESYMSGNVKMSGTSSIKVRHTPK